MRDEELKERIQEVYTSNYRVYGARKIWRELNRQGHTVARCTIERLMRELGITGAVRGKKVITTITDPAAGRAPDLLDRDFVARAPNRCWVADFTHVAAWSGVVYVAFVVDTFSRRIVGWSASTSKETQLVLDALEMALWQRDREDRRHTPGQLIHDSTCPPLPHLRHTPRPGAWEVIRISREAAKDPCSDQMIRKSANLPDDHCCNLQQALGEGIFIVRTNRMLTTAVVTAALVFGGTATAFCLSRKGL